MLRACSIHSCKVTPAKSVCNSTCALAHRLRTGQEPFPFEETVELMKLVIGGIRKIDEEKYVGGIPWFMNIPFLGWMFKAEDINNQKREILIFVTPKILKEAEGLARN